MKQTKTLQVGVKTFIFNKEGKVLLMKRDPIKYPGVTNPWDIPGGRIDPGTDLLSNLNRKVFEEVKLKIMPLGIMGAQDIIREDKHVVRITYISRVTSGKVALSDEHTEYKWESLHNIAKLKGIDPYAKIILKDKSLLSLIKTLIK